MILAGLIPTIYARTYWFKFANINGYFTFFRNVWEVDIHITTNTFGLIKCMSYWIIYIQRHPDNLVFVLIILRLIEVTQRHRLPNRYNI